MVWLDSRSVSAAVYGNAVCWYSDLRDMGSDGKRSRWRKRNTDDAWWLVGRDFSATLSADCTVKSDMRLHVVALTLMSSD